MADDLNHLVPLQPGGTRTPLFCVHAVSGSAYSYAGLVQQLGPNQPVYGLEAPGFDDERTPLRSLPALSAAYVEVLREFQPQGDFQLLGWSMGGVIAFDMAQRLVAAGEKVSTVVLVDSGLPWVADLPTEKEIQRRFMGDVTGILGESMTTLEPAFAGLPADVDPATTFAAVQESGVLPEELDAYLLEERYAVFRAHIEALFAFEITEPYDGPVVHILAADSPPEYMRWDQVSTDFVEHRIPGSTHHSIWQGDNLVALSKLVSTVISFQEAPA